MQTKSIHSLRLAIAIVSTLGCYYANGITMTSINNNSSSQQYAYASSDATNQIWSYKAGSNGDLVKERSIETPAAINGLTIYNHQLYATDASNHIDIYTIGDDGKLTLHQTQTTGANPLATVFNNQHAYVVNNNDNTIYEYDVLDNGTLDYIGQTATQTLPNSISFYNGYAYVINAGSNSISIYHPDPLSGLLTKITDKKTYSNMPLGIQFHNGSAYVTNASFTDSAVWMYKVNNDGTLDYRSELQTFSNPNQLIFIGSHVYITDINYNQVWKYAVEANNTFSSQEATYQSGNIPTYIVSDNPQNAYVVNSQDNTFWHYAIDGSGKLNYSNSVQAPVSPSALVFTN